MRFEFLSLGVSRGLMNKMEETAKCNSLQVTALLLEMVGKALISLLPQLRGRYGMSLSCWMCITCASKCTNSHFHVLCSKCVITKPTGISPLWGWRWRSASFLGSGWAEATVKHRAMTPGWFWPPLMHPRCRHLPPETQDCTSAPKCFLSLTSSPKVVYLIWQSVL